MSEASDMMEVGPNGLGWVAVARDSLMALKAAVVSSLQLSLWSFPVVAARSLLSDPRIEAQLGIKRW